MSDGFIILRYRSMLGEKRGHDVTQQPRPPHMSDREKVVQLHELKPSDDVEILLPEDKGVDAIGNEDIRSEIQKAKDLDASFTVDSFLKGAGAAFEMVMQAYNEGDRETLKMLLSKEIYQSFDEELKKAKEENRFPHDTLVAMKSAEITGAQLKSSVLSMRVAFLSEQIHVVRDKDGKIIEGDASLIEEVADEWEFERNMKSRNPNWTITDM
jgi:predicted lipid-binding transport protein (Tim44 family)